MTDDMEGSFGTGNWESAMHK